MLLFFIKNIKKNQFLMFKNTNLLIKQKTI